MSLNAKRKKMNLFDLYYNSNNIYYESQGEINIFKNDINQYRIKEIIGEGMFGKVKLAIHLITNEKVAIKIFDKGKIKSNKEKQYIEREISILKKLNHYNIIKLYNIIEDENYIYLIQEYISDKELLNFIQTSEDLSEKDICRLYQQIISGIEYCHEMGIAHRDLKLQNILLNYKKDIKIIDFGLSNNYDKDMDELLHSSCGSPIYAAPEMIKGIEYRGLNTDIWSSGIILYLMLCKCFPFNDKNNSKLYQKILAGKFNIPNNLSNDAKDIIIKLLKVNPQERIKLNDIKNHPWFNLINKSKNYCKGIDNTKIIMPMDGEIIKEIVKFGVDKSTIINNILINNFNNITTTYNLLLQKKIRNGKKSVADFKSELYIKYINDEKNKFAYFNNDLDLIIKNRIKNLSNNGNKAIPNINIEFGYHKNFGNIQNYNYSYNYLLGKTNPKISKSDENKDRQITERQKDINILLNYSNKFHTIDHDSYSNSKKKKISNKKLLKNKISDLTQFSTKKNNNYQNNINIIRTNGYILNKNKERLSTIHNYLDAKKSNDLYLSLLYKKTYNRSHNKYNNHQNYKQYIFNKSVDFKLCKDKNINNGINNYININNSKLNKTNKMNKIRKKIRNPIEIEKNIRTIENPNSGTPLKTEIEKNYRIENSFINMGISEKVNSLVYHNKKRYSNDKIKNSNNENENKKILNHNGYIINKNRNKNNLIMGLSFNNNSNNYCRDINNFGFDNFKTKRNSYFIEEKIKEKKKVRSKKASSLSVDLNYRNQGKNEINIFNNNKPKRKNVMKFVNKNNNDNLNNMNLKLNNNIHNKYGYFYKNEMKKNIYNKSLESNINKKYII